MMFVCASFSIATTWNGLPCLCGPLPLCEVYAKLIGLLLQHWLIVAFAWQDDQRSGVKLARVVRDTVCGLLQLFTVRSVGHRLLSVSSDACKPAVR